MVLEVPFIEMRLMLPEITGILAGPGQAGFFFKEYFDARLRCGIRV